MQEILVSVLTPCYNSVKTIEKTLECIERQTYQNIEYIIVDGGSTDGTLELIEQHRSRLPQQFTLILHGFQGQQVSFPPRCFQSQERLLNW